MSAALLCQEILAAMEGQDVREADLISAICRAPRDVATRASLRYQALMGQTLEQALTRGADSLHRRALAAVCRPREEVVLSWLRGAVLAVAGAPDAALLDILHLLCTRSDAELPRLVSAYRESYGADLALDLGAALARLPDLPDGELIRRALVSLLCCFGSVEAPQPDADLRREAEEAVGALASAGPQDAAAQARGRPATLLVSLLASGCYALEPFGGDLQADPYLALVQKCFSAGLLSELGRHAFTCLRLRPCPAYQWAYVLRCCLLGLGAQGGPGGGEGAGARPGAARPTPAPGLTEGFARAVILCYDAPHDLLEAYARISRSQDRGRLAADVKAAAGPSDGWVAAVCATLLEPREG